MEEGGSKVSIRVTEHEKGLLAIVGFQHTRGPQVKNYGPNLETKKGQEIDSPLEPPEGTQPNCHPDFNPGKII